MKNFLLDVFLKRHSTYKALLLHCKLSSPNYVACCRKENKYAFLEVALKNKNNFIKLCPNLSSSHQKHLTNWV